MKDSGDSCADLVRFWILAQSGRALSRDHAVPNREYARAEPSSVECCCFLGCSKLYSFRGRSAAPKYKFSNFHLWKRLTFLWISTTFLRWKPATTILKKRNSIITIECDWSVEKCAEKSNTVYVVWFIFGRHLINIWSIFYALIKK